jgi:site-specific recombinase XerD
MKERDSAYFRIGDNRMNIQNVNEIIQNSRMILRDAGLTDDYIENLSYTWNAFRDYWEENPGDMSKEYASRFLFERYGILLENGTASISAIGRRRRRAIHILLSCAGNQSPFTAATYWEYNFSSQFYDAFSSFMDYRKSGGYAFSTINRDTYCLNKFSEYLSLLKVEEIRSINGETIIGFIKWLAAKTGLPMVKGAASSLRLLASYLYREKYVDHNLSAVVPPVHVHKDVPSTYTFFEIDAMLESMRGNSPVAIRNYAMTLLAVRLGMRSSDICGLQMQNIDWRKSEISFSTIKTGKYTVLPLTAEVGNAIIRYLKEARPSSGDCHLFLRLQKPFRQLRPAVMHKMVTISMRDAGVQIPYGRRHGPHALRASLASNMLRNNISLPVISETLSHSSTDTTRIYLKVDFEHLRHLSMEVPPLDGVWMGGMPL